MTIDLNLIRKPEAEKVSIQLVLYKATHEKLQSVCREEKVKLTHLLRHLINSFLNDREKEKTHE